MATAASWTAVMGCVCECVCVRVCVRRVWVCVRRVSAKRREIAIARVPGLIIYLHLHQLCAEITLA